MIKPLQQIIIGVTLFLINTNTCLAQTIFKLDTSIVVTEGGIALDKAWTGGLDCPMYYTIDLDNNGVKDLFIFDHKSNRILTFINNNIPNTVSYTYAPQYEKYFPRMNDWAITYDYDCDGYNDIFTSGNGGIAVYQNKGLFPLQFNFITNQINSTYNLGFPFVTNIYANSISVPAFVDVDNDGDMDIINFANGANYLEYHKNYSMDSTGQCGGFRFYNIRRCWGYFTLDGSKNVARLPPATIISNDCPAYPATSPRSNSSAFNVDSVRHSGNLITAIDMEGDGDKDILIGDIVSSNLLYVENGGTPDSAYATSQDTLFPSYDIPAKVDVISAPYILDLDNDGKNDMLVANFNADVFSGGGDDINHTHFYKNIATAPNDHVFHFIKNSFLSEEMIDAGTGSHPAFFDVDHDGKLDLLIAADYVFTNDTAIYSQISYYHNSGNSTNPQYDLITRDYLGISANHWKGIYPAFGDIDGDGDEDLLLGNDSSWLAYYNNSGGAGPANFTFVTTHYQNISVGSLGQSSTPQLFDLDQDGLLDLIIGRRSGTLYYYHNSGTTSNPVFTFVTSNLGGVTVYDPTQLVGYSIPLFYDSAGTTQLLVGSYTGTIYHYNNINGNLGGQFNLTDSAYMGIYEPVKASPTMADLNADGLFDLVIGNIGGGLRCYKQSFVIGIDETPTIDPLFVFYPNPVNDALTIDFNESTNSGDREISIFNVLGEKIIYLKSKSKRETINLQNISGGSYIISVTHKDKILSQKFVKQ